MALKNYKPYLKKIKAYAKASGIKLKPVKNLDGFGEYSPNNRTIKFDPSMSKENILSTLLHELGHFMDDYRNPNKFAGRHHTCGRTRIEKDFIFLSVNQKQAVWESEIEAWKNARAIALKLKIPLGKWFTKDETSSLNTYRSIRTY